MIEDTEATRRRRALLRARLGRVALTCLGTFVVVWGGLAVWLYRLHFETDYPNGTTQNSETFADYHSSLVVRRNAVYKSRDSYTTVFRWYSKGFNLGNAARGTGSCDQMAMSAAEISSPKM